jgi:hypothetical protein
MTSNVGAPVRDGCLPVSDGLPTVGDTNDSATFQAERKCARRTTYRKHNTRFLHDHRTTKDMLNRPSSTKASQKGTTDMVEIGDTVKVIGGVYYKKSGRRPRLAFVTDVLEKMYRIQLPDMAKTVIVKKKNVQKVQPNEAQKEVMMQQAQAEKEIELLNAELAGLRIHKAGLQDAKGREDTRPSRRVSPVPFH